VVKANREIIECHLKYVHMYTLSVNVQYLNVKAGGTH
jgi:hypothetical protein